MKNHNRLFAGALFAASVSAGAIGVHLMSNSIEEGHQSEQYTAALHEMPPHTGYNPAALAIAEAAESANEHSFADGFTGILILGAGAGALAGAGVEVRKTAQ